MKERNEKIFLIVVILILLCLTISGWYLVYENSKSNKNLVDNNTKVVNELPKVEPQSIKVNDSKELVYNAEYTNDVEIKSYKTEFEQTGKIDDIVVPYININSEDAKVVNNKISDLYKGLVDQYKLMAAAKLGITKASYKTYKTDKTLSVVIETIKAGTDIPLIEYYTYTFNLETKKVMSYQDVYKSASLNEETTYSKVEAAIVTYMNSKGSQSWAENDRLQNYGDKTQIAYDKSVEDGTIKYFLDENSNLNVVIDVKMPIGSGSFETIFNIK